MNADAIRSFAAFAVELAQGSPDGNPPADAVCQAAEHICRLAQQERATGQCAAAAMNEIAMEHGFLATLTGSDGGHRWPTHDPSGRRLLWPCDFDDGDPVPIPDLPADLALGQNQTRHLVLLHWHDDDAGPPAMWEFVLSADADDRQRHILFEDAFTLCLRIKLARDEAADVGGDWDLADPDFLADMAKHGIAPWHGPSGYSVHDWYEDGWYFKDQDPCCHGEELAKEVGYALARDKAIIAMARAAVADNPGMQRAALHDLLTEHTKGSGADVDALIELLIDNMELLCDDETGVLTVPKEDNLAST